MPPKLVKIAIAQTAPLASGSKIWAVVKKTGNVIVEATTAPKNTAEEWKLIQWSGDSGEAVQSFPNRRKLSLSTSKKYPDRSRTCARNQRARARIVAPV